MSTRSIFQRLSEHLDISESYVRLRIPFRLRREGQNYKCPKCLPDVNYQEINRFELVKALEHFCECSWDAFAENIWLYPNEDSHFSSESSLIKLGAVERMVKILDYLETPESVRDVLEDLSSLAKFKREIVDSPSIKHSSWSPVFLSALENIYVSYQQRFEFEPELLREALLEEATPKVNSGEDLFEDVLAEIKDVYVSRSSDFNLKMRSRLAGMLNELNSDFREQFMPVLKSERMFLVPAPRLAEHWEPVLGVGGKNHLLVVPEIFTNVFKFHPDHCFLLPEGFRVTNEFVDIFDGLFDRSKNSPYSTLKRAAEATMELINN